jgi:hypothetical protein
MTARRWLAAGRRIAGAGSTRWRGRGTRGWPQHTRRLTLTPRAVAGDFLTLACNSSPNRDRFRFNTESIAREGATMRLQSFPPVSWLSASSFVMLMQRRHGRVASQEGGTHIFSRSRERPGGMVPGLVVRVELSGTQLLRLLPAHAHARGLARLAARLHPHGVEPHHPGMAAAHRPAPPRGGHAAHAQSCCCVGGASQVPEAMNTNKTQRTGRRGEGKRF